jgi:hypothetical protein
MKVASASVARMALSPRLSTMAAACGFASFSKRRSK